MLIFNLWGETSKTCSIFKKTLKQRPTDSNTKIFICSKIQNRILKNFTIMLPLLAVRRTNIFLAFELVFY